MKKQPSLYKLTFSVTLGLILATLALIALCLNPTTDLISKPLTVNNVQEPADVIIALSAGIIEDCDPHPNLVKRESFAGTLLHDGYSQSKKMIITGHYFSPDNITQETCHKKLAKQLNVPEESLIIDNQAFSTRENVLNSKKIMRQNDWKNALIVTEKSHMLRASLAFKKEGIETNPVILPDYPVKGKTWHDIYRMEYIRRFLYEYGALVMYKWYGYI